MADYGQEKEPRQGRNAPGVDDAQPRSTPSQAEGDRDTVDADLEQKFGRARTATGGGGEGDTVNTPSQAEGDREEIDEDLRQRGDE